MARPLRILIVGATGLLGQALSRHLTNRGDEVFAFSRRSSHFHKNEITWLEWSGTSAPDNVPEQLDAVINLAGESIAAGRWTAHRKKLLISSRIDSTRFLVEGFRKLTAPPRLFLSASATGYYGNSERELLTESSGNGVGFLAELTNAWEREALRAEPYECQVTLMRFGVVLTPLGGALKKMLLPFQLGLGGRLGAGTQFMSWITLEDLVAAVDFLLRNPLRGAVNLAAPEACQNDLFTRALATALKRPAYVPVPAWLLKLIFGQLAQELFLFSTRAYPARLLEAGFTFRQPEICSACRSLLPGPSPYSDRNNN